MTRTMPPARERGLSPGDRISETMADHADTCEASRHRRRHRLGFGAAFLALVLQFIAGFGHFHPEDFKAFGHGGAATLVADGTSPASGHDGPGLPTHDDCAICVVLHMAGGATLPVAPVLLAPPQDAVTVPNPSPGRRIAWPAHYLFQTRGPPRA